jgi:hypothetical protein
MQFDRVINAQIRLIDESKVNYRGLLTVENLRMAFSIFKSESFSTNTANIRIYNLSANKRNQLANFGDQVRLAAGYRNDSGPQLLFLGDSTQVSHIFAQPEIISVIDCGDGDKTINNTTISVSFAAGTSVRDVIQSIAQRMGLTIAEFSASDGLVYTQGFKFTGLAKFALEKATNYLNLVPSVQNGNLYILDRALGSSKPPVEINADTGMIGIPERYTDKRQYLYRSLPPDGAPRPGWKVKTLLRPDVLPGDKIRIRSTRADINGVFYVISARHEGDNFGPVFETTFEVIAV